MISWLKNHPFAVEAHFDSSLVFTFAVPKEEVIPLIPECLEPDVFDNKWAFIAIAMVQTKDLRPKGFPAFLGNDFFLIGYRVFVRYTNAAGRNLRGLFILKSETDKKKMEFFGNIFTHYHYSTTDIVVESNGEMTSYNSHKSGFQVVVGGNTNNGNDSEIPLPTSSPFVDWKEARRFAGPLPFTFTYDRVKKEVLIIEGVRENWKPEPVKVLDYHFSFLNQLNFNNPVLANAFIIRDIPYYWKKGKIESWHKKEDHSRVSSIS